MYVNKERLFQTEHEEVKTILEADKISAEVKLERIAGVVGLVEKILEVSEL